MAPVEWPIAARSDDRAAKPTRRVDRDRLPTVRADFFLDASARLTEQERSLMTAMLADLVAAVADEVRAAAQLRSAANDDSADLYERLSASGLLDIPQVIAVLLCRAEQERVAATIRAPGSATPATFLHILAANDDAEVSAAAMAVILGRSRRRDRFDAPRLDLDDVPADAAVNFVYVVLAAVREEEGAAGPEADRRLADGARSVLARHDEGKRMEGLWFALVHALDGAGQLDDETLRSALGDGEIGIFTEILSRRAGVDFGTAWKRVAAGGSELACLLRMAAVPREVAAEIAAAMSDSGSTGPAELIGLFDSLSDEAVENARGWLRLDPHYREAISALGGADGNATR